MEKRLLTIVIIALIIPLAHAFGTCGNGAVEKFEQCDDSNSNNGDGCSSLCQKEGENFQVIVYSASDPPPTPTLTELPLLSSITKDGITWTFSSPARVGRFVNGDYYVVGTVTVSQISPFSSNAMHGSMMNIQPSIQMSGFDSRIGYSRYDSSLRLSLPITLTPGNKLVSSRSSSSNLKAVMRPIDDSESPVASVSMLTSVSSPQPLDAFRPSYAEGSNSIYLSRNLRRDTLPRLAPVAHTAPFSEFEGYLRRPWIDSLFFNFDVPAEYMASYGRENGYIMSFAGLLLTLDYPQEKKEPLLVYMVQYGIDLYGLVEQGHSGWQAHGGHGSGRKFPILLAGVMLNEAQMKDLHANFGEDMQTIYVTETPPSGTYTKSWHQSPVTVVYGGHVGVNGVMSTGWGPYEHLPPSQWKGDHLGESYRRCCTSVGWVGEALAARLIPGMKEAWGHSQFFEYVDRWMSPENSADLSRIDSEAGWAIDGDFQQGQSWKILSGGGYYETHKTFVDEMWAEYRDYTPSNCAHKADNSPCDGCIQAGELTSFVASWKNSNTIMLGELMEAIKIWKEGC
jgi:cysteine-rich repeat protein